jgi:ABC-2 type transport system permease protein
MTEILRIWIQEYRRILSDAGVVLIVLGAIIVYPIVYPIPYAHEVLTDVPVAVVDQDHTALTRRLTRMIDAGELIRAAARPANFEEARASFFSGEVNGILVIPHDFTRKVMGGQQANIAAYSDAAYFLIYRQALTGILRSAGTMSAGIAVKRLRAGGLSENQALAARDPVPLISNPLYNPAAGYASYVVPAVLVLILQQTLLIGVGMLAGTARERQAAEGFPELIPSTGPVKTVLGRAGAYFSLYLVYAIYFFGVLFRLYEYPQRGHLLTVLIYMLPFLLAIVFLALALSTAFRNRETSMLALLFTSIPVLFLSGFSWPIEAMPGWLRVVSLLLPSTAGISGFLRVQIMGAELGDVAFEWLVLWGLSGLYFLFACLSIKRIAARKP